MAEPPFAQIAIAQVGQAGAAVAVGVGTSHY